MERYFAVPLDQFALDQLTADLGAENSSAAAFSTGNATGSTTVYSELWSVDEIEEKAILITPIGQQSTVGFVSPLWQRVALVVMTAVAFNTFFQHVSSAEARRSSDAGILDILGRKLVPLACLSMGCLLGAASYCYLPAWTKYLLRKLSLEAHDVHTMKAIHKQMLRDYCVVMPLTSLCKFVEELGSDLSGNFISGKALMLFCRHFFSAAVFVAVVFWFQVTYSTIMRVRRWVFLSLTPVLCLLQLYNPYEFGWFPLFRWQLGCVMLQTSLTTHLQESAYTLAIMIGVAAPDSVVLRCAWPVFFSHAVGIVMLCAKLRWMSHFEEPLKNQNCYCAK